MADVVHDSEYYILDAQHGEVWAGEDRDLDAKLAGMGERFGSPPNIIHIMWDDTAVGEIGIPAVQRVRGFETPNMNRLAAEGINFMRMYTEPSCTPSRAAVITGRHAVRSGMYNVSFPYEYGGLPSSEVTMADVLSEAGYATAFYGKAHLGDIEASYMTNRGFDEALWMPYNQVPSLFTPQGQMAVLSPAVMFPEDRYDKDPGWRPNGYVFALEGTKGATSGSGSASIQVCPGARVLRSVHRSARAERQDASDVPGQGHVQHDEGPPSAVGREVSAHGGRTRLAAHRHRECPPGDQGRRPAARGPLQTPVRPVGGPCEVLCGWEGVEFDRTE
jgi:hypothetical protein